MLRRDGPRLAGTLRKRSHQFRWHLRWISVLGVALRAGLLRAPLPLGLPAGRPLRALHIPNAKSTACAALAAAPPARPCQAEPVTRLAPSPRTRRSHPRARFAPPHPGWRQQRRRRPLPAQASLVPGQACHWACLAAPTASALLLTASFSSQAGLQGRMRGPPERKTMLGDGPR